MKTKILTIALAALAIGLLGSCKKEDPKVSVTGVSLNKTELTITVGDQPVQLTATVAPENATDKTVNWASDKAEVATVDNQGSVHAVAPGEAIITVTTTDGGKTATCVVKVKAAVVPVSSVALDKTELTLTVGDPDVKLVATVTPDNATDKTVNWASDKAEVATVDDQGNVHAVAPGEAIITVTTVDGSKTATCTVTVKADVPDGPLPGKFSVSADKKVHFSKGNLWADGNKALHFEANQYSSASSWDASHVSHFTWSDNVASAVGDSNSGSNLFCDESHKVSVDGGEAIYYALSTDEWTYLFKTRTMPNGGDRYENLTSSGITVQGVVFKGVVLFPDNFTEQATWKDTYTTWEALNNAGLVFLPAAGRRRGSDVRGVGFDGYYWSSTASGGTDAYLVFFSSSNVYPDSLDFRYYGYSVRLITESK